MEILWKRGEIAPKEHFLLFSTIFCCLLVDFCVKTGTRFSLRDKRLFEIREFEITRVSCIQYGQMSLVRPKLQIRHFFLCLKSIDTLLLLCPATHWITGTGYREVHGGMGYGRPKPDVEGERILEYALAFDLLLGSTCFKKRDSHLITYKSGNIPTQLDFILFCRTMRNLVTDCHRKVIPGEEVALQHQLLVCEMRIDVPPKSKRKFTPRLKVWKLKDPQTSNHFQEVFNLHVSTSAGVADGATEDIWNNIKTGLLKTTEEVCGTTRSHRWLLETWWWNEHVEKAIAAKRTAFKAWKASKGTRASYYAAKRNARHAVHHTRQEADKKVYENIDPKSSEVYPLANQFRRENTDAVGDKPVKNDAGDVNERRLKAEGLSRALPKASQR